jgi:transposase
VTVTFKDTVGELERGVRWVVEAAMCLKIQSPWQMPDETRRIGQQLLDEKNTYRLIGDELFTKLNEEDFADLYPSEGQPGFSPVVLAFVTVFQFIEKLPDRQAAEALRMRLDWKYALHLALDDEGFNFSVLSEFRDRLIAGKAEGRVFEKLVAQIREMGLIKKQGKQRTDSIAMLSKVRWLSRLEIAVETLRLAVVSLVKVDQEWSAETLPPSWEDKYEERFVMERHTEKEWKEYEENIGNDGQWLLKRLKDGGAPAGLQELSNVKLLETVWAQQFREEAGKMAFKELKKYDGHTQIATPHDPEARYSQKRHFEWVGDKVQVTDTDDAGYPHIITDIVSTESNLTDYEALPDIQDRLEQRQCKPDEHYVDAGYMSGSNLANSENMHIDLIGPLSSPVTAQDRIVDGITQAQFQVDAQQKSVICPQGHCATQVTQIKDGWRFMFPKETCAVCPLCSRCCTGKDGRTIRISAYYELRQQAFARQKTETFKQDYAQHRSGVEGSLSALVRGNGLRVGRYIGQKKRNLQSLFTGCAANLQRTSCWLAGKRPQVRRKSWTLQAT